MWVWGEESHRDSLSLSDLFVVMNTDEASDTVSFCLDSFATHTDSWEHIQALCVPKQQLHVHKLLFNLGHLLVL